MAEKERTPRPDHITGQSPTDWINVELSSRRTGMSFQRTRMSVDRTLMSVIRTSLSVIGFGFTIFQIFQKMYEAKMLPTLGEARHFGTALLVLGCVTLVAGIGYHIAFTIGLRKERIAMRDDDLIHVQPPDPPRGFRQSSLEAEIRRRVPPPV